MLSTRMWPIISRVMVQSTRLNQRVLSRSSPLCTKVTNNLSPSHGKEPSSGDTGTKESSHNLPGDKESLVDTEWITIFRFPHIVTAKLLSRAKMYQTVITTYLAGKVIYLYVIESATLKNMYFTLGISIFAWGTLTVLGIIVQRLIGFIYVNQERTKIKLSHLTFWGGRKDVIVDIDHIYPIVNSPGSALVRKVVRTDDQSKYLFLCLQFGGIKEPEIFGEVMGWNESMGGVDGPLETILKMKKK